MDPLKIFINECAAWPRGGARPLFWRVAIPTPRVGLLGAGGQSAQLSQLLPFLILCFLKSFFSHGHRGRLACAEELRCLLGGPTDASVGVIFSVVGCGLGWRMLLKKIIK